MALLTGGLIGPRAVPSPFGPQTRPLQGVRALKEIWTGRPKWVKTTTRLQGSTLPPRSTDWTRLLFEPRGSSLKIPSAPPPPGAEAGVRLNWTPRWRSHCGLAEKPRLRPISTARKRSSRRWAGVGTRWSPEGSSTSGQPHKGGYKYCL